MLSSLEPKKEERLGIEKGKTSGLRGRSSGFSSRKNDVNALSPISVCSRNAQSAGDGAWPPNATGMPRLYGNRPLIVRNECLFALTCENLPD